MVSYGFHQTCNKLYSLNVISVTSILMHQISSKKTYNQVVRFYVYGFAVRYFHQYRIEENIKFFCQSTKKTLTEYKKKYSKM